MLVPQTLAMTRAGGTPGARLLHDLSWPTLHSFLLEFPKKIGIVISCPDFSEHRKMSLKSFYEDSEIAIIPWGQDLGSHVGLTDPGISATSWAGKPGRVTSPPVSNSLFCIWKGACG